MMRRNKKRIETARSSIPFKCYLLTQELCHLVELKSKAGLLVSGVVLVKDTVSNCLVYLLNSKSVKLRSSGLVAGLNSSVELLDSSLKLALDHLVSKRLSLVYKYTLFSGLNVSHFLLL